MGIIVKIVATLMIFVGVSWLLQGLGVLGGSTMTGDIKWALIGGAGVVIGVVAWLVVGRRPPPPAA